MFHPLDTEITGSVLPCEHFQAILLPGGSAEPSEMWTRSIVPSAMGLALDIIVREILDGRAIFAVPMVEAPNMIRLMLTPGHNDSYVDAQFHTSRDALHTYGHWHAPGQISLPQAARNMKDDCMFAAAKATKDIVQMSNGHLTYPVTYVASWQGVSNHQRLALQGCEQRYQALTRGQPTTR
jgi:hypothetical protein